MSAWHLKKADGSIFGPVEEGELREWAADGRVAPDDEVSEDREHWQPASDLSGLDMLWSVEIGEGDSFGPINILAAAELIRDGAILPGATARHQKSGQTMTAQEALVSALMGERQALQSQLAEKEKQHRAELEQQRAEAKGREEALGRKLAELMTKYRSVVDKVGKIQASLARRQAAAAPAAAGAAPAAEAAVSAERPAEPPPAKASQPAEAAVAPPSEPGVEKPEEPHKRVSVSSAFKSAAARFKTQSAAGQAPAKVVKKVGAKGLSSSDIPRGSKHGG